MTRVLERDEFSFAPAIEPISPAQAGTQGQELGTQDWVPASAGTNGINAVIYPQLI
jgi:hypothetical protein